MPLKHKPILTVSAALSLAFGGLATAPIAAAEGDKGDVDKQMRAADAEVVAGAPEKAFDRLIKTMKTTAGDEKSRLRERLLELFGLFEGNDPRVMEARTKLASALY